MRARTEEAKDQRRAAFLNAAMDEFFDKGFAAARVDDIAKRAGFSKGTLYLYFESKEAMFKGLVDTIAVPKLEYMEGLTTSAPSARMAIEGLLKFAPEMIRQSMLPRVVKVMIADGNRFPEVATTYKEAVIDRGLALIAGLLERGRREGDFAFEDSDLTARLFIAPLVFSMLWHILFEKKPEDHMDLNALFALHGAHVIRALAPRHETQPSQHQEDHHDAAS
ncbi:MAG: TetR/AcrR family transcriptional regulator [Rhodospirillaceae bacterium]